LAVIVSITGLLAVHFANRSNNIHYI
jgi:hypothetical protein